MGTACHQRDLSGMMGELGAVYRTTSRLSFEGN